jgi:RNA polymerase sigma-70 factor (ECF subfamily)
MSPALQGKFDESDLVQETLLKAHQKHEQFRGETDAEQAVWLHQILVNHLRDLARRYASARRDLLHEQPLEVRPEESAAPLASCVATDSPSPSHLAMLQEEKLRLLRAMAKLSDDQRTAVEMKHLQGRSVEEIGRRLGRGTTAVGGLLRRGMKRLRQLLRDQS